MDHSDLIRMANQIARFFEPYPEEEAIAGVAGHIRSFWDPRMRKAYLELAPKSGDQLHHLARAAADRLAEPPS